MQLVIMTGTALLLKYDSVHGTIPNEVTFDEENIYVDGKKNPCIP